MKLTYLTIEGLNQIGYLDLDLTYPEGHPKKGEPLDKICIIGQSGTGKTTLLQVIKSMFYPENPPVYKGFYGTFRDNNTVINAGNYISSELNKITYHIIYPSAFLDDEGSVEDFNIRLNKKNVALMDFPADFLSRNTNEKYTIVDPHLKKYDFNEISVEGMWHLIIESIKKLREDELVIRQQISKVAEGAFSADEMFRRMQPFLDQLKALEQDESNPLKKLARECLDPILNYFNLQVCTRSDIIEDFDKMGFIEIENRDGEIVPNGFLSTGTRQFLFSILPFYLLKPNNAVILFDEPERSLYPNIQKLLVPYYSKFAPNCQIIYATHSPIVASCFDPWEVIELQFDEDGWVSQKLYYTGDRHVDNYTINPKYLTYELILKEVFDVSETEGEQRAEKLAELAMYENQLDTFKKNEDSNSDKFKAVLNKYLKLAEQLSWPKKFN